jgi:hypothetical protein
MVCEGLLQQGLHLVNGVSEGLFLGQPDIHLVTVGMSEFLVAKPKSALFAEKVCGLR